MGVGVAGADSESESVGQSEEGMGGARAEQSSEQYIKESAIDAVDLTFRAPTLTPHDPDPSKIIQLSSSPAPHLFAHFDVFFFIFIWFVASVAVVIFRHEVS
uniref:Uncharacterized protein n=1 Tax=Caenorhabditis japonica TaxID=281687 RepID=A0A8R1IWU6_CAEJA